jgi:hypothetical protein
MAKRTKVTTPDANGKPTFLGKGSTAAKKKRDAKYAKIAEMPTIAMCEWEQSGPNKNKIGSFLWRSEVIKLTKRSVTMRAIGSKTATVTVSVKSGSITDYVKIEMMPCDTTVWGKPDEKMKTYLKGAK